MNRFSMLLLFLVLLEGCGGVRHNKVAMDQPRVCPPCAQAKQPELDQVLRFQNCNEVELRPVQGQSPQISLRGCKPMAANDRTPNVSPVVQSPPVEPKTSVHKAAVSRDLSDREYNRRAKELTQETAWQHFLACKLRPTLYYPRLTDRKIRWCAHRHGIELKGKKPLTPELNR